MGRKSNLLLMGCGGADVAAGGYSTTGAKFDSTDLMNRGAGLTGAVDGQEGCLSFWLNLLSGDGNFRIILESNDLGMQIYVSNTNKMTISWTDTGLAGVCSLISTSNYVAADGWTHIMAAWSGSGAVAQLYRDGVDDAATAIMSGTDLEWIKAGWTFSARPGGSLYCNAEYADFYLNSAEYLALTNSANRDLFYNAGSPVDLDDDGSTPTGNAPIIFFKGGASTWETNLGGGGDFTAVGTLTDSDTDP